ncbi:MAG: 1-acyl-sn-glycerol-3-phosphate acyltransferase [Deltaproteobacteria bacterium]|nr:1-acyl-sn-glycerol-3-phosphate acyltransferase [Deltaproteobacteria bacterium]
MAETLFRFGREPTDSVRERADRLRWVAENLAALHGLDIRVKGPEPDGPCALVANHLGYLDPVAILAHVPCIPIAKAEVADWPLLGEIGEATGCLFVRRECAMSGAAVLRGALRCLDAGVPVLAFPEGTTTAGDRVLPFFRGLFGVARIADVPVVPMTVRYFDGTRPWIGNDPFVPHYLRTAASARGRVEVTFHAPIAAKGSPEVIAERAREAIASAL